jgi:hypothetical protein
MPTCSERERLIVEYHQAVEMFSRNVKLLRECNGDGYHKFQERHRATEIARLHAENARLMVDFHRTEHGC